MQERVRRMYIVIELQNVLNSSYRVRVLINQYGV
jgi:hypothetical protein